MPLKTFFCDFMWFRFYSFWSYSCDNVVTHFIEILVQQTLKRLSTKESPEYVLFKRKNFHFLDKRSNSKIELDALPLYSRLILTSYHGL